MPKKINIQDVQKKFNDLGYTLLSPEYENSKTKLDFICKCGEKCQATWNAIRHQLKRKEAESSLKELAYEEHQGSCKKCGVIKRNKTIMKIYGVVNISQSEDIKNKKRQTCLNNFGVEVPQQSKEIQTRTKQTVLGKYGVDNVSKAPEIIARIQAVRKWTQESIDKHNKTCIERYGVNWAEKRKETMLNKYGVAYPGAIKGHWEKAMATCQKRYGVSHPLHNPEIMVKNIKSHFSGKKYTFPSGHAVHVLGYEPFALDELIKRGYTEDDIYTSPIDMPRIWYEWEGTTRKYYPDIYIKSENLFIEVKSTWTLQKQLELNKAKFDAVTNQNIELWCYDSRGEIVELWFKT